MKLPGQYNNGSRRLDGATHTHTHTHTHTQHPSPQHFASFCVPAFDDFVIGGRNKATAIIAEPDVTHTLKALGGGRKIQEMSDQGWETLVARSKWVR